MRIGALAHKTGVSERLLRYYEEQGLLQPTRLSNGYREYDESHVATVGHIRALLAAGLPTAVITQILHCVHGDGEQLELDARPVGLVVGDVTGHGVKAAAEWAAYGSQSLPTPWAATALPK